MKTPLILIVAMVALVGCAAAPAEFTLDIREPTDRRLFAGVTLIHLSAERDARSLGQQDYPPTVDQVSLDGVSYGPRTVFILEGTTATGDVIARGQTCPFDFTAPSGPGPRRAALSFAPTNSFAPTVRPPNETRTDPSVWTLADGTVVIAGGVVAGAATTSIERFSAATSTFVVDANTTLSVARAHAEVTDVAGIGTFLSGGISAAGTPLGSAELYRLDDGSVTRIDNAAIGARLGHRALTLASDRILLTGGVSTIGGAPIVETAIVSVQPDGTATASSGPPLQLARHRHAAVVASGIPVLIGGYGADGAPLASIEALVPSDTSLRGEFKEIASLRTARAEATATLLIDGTILVIGGARDAAGTPLLDAEVYNPITEKTTVYPLAVARRGHSATTLADGRVLVAGGLGSDGAPLSSVELFVPGIGFVSERPLATPRFGHRALPLCDGTVLVVGGGAGAEVYSPPP